jgi:putative DNA primase/helicase
MKQITDSLFSFEKTNDKNNILREVSDLIFSPEFVKDMNKEKYILPIKNKKMLQLKTLEVVDRTELHKFDYECDAMYKELTETEDEDINKYFSDLFVGDKEMKQVVLNILKSTMTGESLRYIYFLTGTGCNGKSVLFNILRAIFKKGIDVISKDVVLQKKGNSHLNTEVEKLDKCRCAYLTELKEEDKMNEQMIKAITGGDPINLRGICKTDETIEPTANMFVLTNKLPQFEVEKAICDRLIIIPFLAVFEVNKKFENDMIEKRDLVFSFIMKHGIICDKFELPEAMKVAKDNYIADNNEDSLNEFLEANVIRGGKGKIARDEVRARYNDYLNMLPKSSISHQSATSFTKMMKEKYSIPNIKSNGKTFYTGISWRIDDDVEDE